MSNVSNIDEMLLNGKITAQNPATPEHQLETSEDKFEPKPEVISEFPDDPEVPLETKETTEADERDSNDSRDTKDTDKPEKTVVEVDDYGNPKAAARTYSEEEVNERINKAIRERLARVERNQAQEPKTETSKDFKYDENADGNWEQQLEQFVEKTFSKITNRQVEQQRQMREQEMHMAFEEKFRSGMTRFGDFTEVVGGMPISDPMTLATRSMADPAAFLYAASKRAPDEIKRIAALSDPYSQMVEMGKLEERLKRQKAQTTAPRPLSRTKEDTSIKHKSEKEPTIEELINQATARKLKQQRDRRR